MAGMVRFRQRATVAAVIGASCALTACVGDGLLRDAAGVRYDVARSFSFEPKSQMLEAMDATLAACIEPEARLADADKRVTADRREYWSRTDGEMILAVGFLPKNHRRPHAIGIEYSDAHKAFGRGLGRRFMTGVTRALEGKPPC